MSDSSPLSTPIHSESEYSESDSDVQSTRIGDNFESEPEGEDLADTVRTDYRAIPELDTYEDAGLDTATYEQMSAEDRLNAELEIRRRNQTMRGPADLGWDSDDEMSIIGRRNRIRQRARDGDLDPLNELFKVDNDNPVILQDVTGPLTQYLERPEIRHEIARRFHDFLINYKSGDGEPLYINRIKQMASQNRISFEVSYVHLAQHTPIIGIWLGDAPTQILEILDDAAFALVTNNALFPEFTRISPEIHVRISDLQIVDELRNLRQIHLNALIKTRGVVTKRTSVFPQLRIVKWKCSRCGNTIGPFPVTDEKPVPPNYCPVCTAKSGFTIDTASTVYRNYQRITIQEPPGSVQPGRLPRTKEVVLYADLADCCRPGEEVEITGIYKHMMDIRRQGFPVFSTMIEANHVSRSGDSYSAISITKEEEQQIIELSKQPDISKTIFESIAPSIFGHENIKAAIALSLFGGRRKDFRDRHNIRGDINVLLLGDPGTAKSQFLKYAESIAPRAVFTTGKGASAVGLTASVHLEHSTGEWTLEGGALVLADGGVCLIDEFDKMSDKDRTSIHEAMEQQSISISKAGIVTTLLARCSVIAACNPIHGRYDGSLSFSQNSGLSEPILSRFDVLCVVKDVVDSILDAKLADYVIKSHQGETHQNGLDEEILRKYIAYARKNVQPKLSDIDNQKLVSLYNELREESEKGGGARITVRHLESIIRLAEAHARLHLRNNVIESDVNFAISLILESFVSTEKYANKKYLEKKFSRYLVYGRDRNDLLLHVIHTMVRERIAFMNLRRSGIEYEDKTRKIVIKKSDFEARAKDIGVNDFHTFYQSQKFRNDFMQTDTEIIREA
ncbi:DNA replication licensing factor Mcm2 [Histomonas meleagridis]|uniref:DNA replication licensing factor Mcm2 n=1 Tax=Histomonas meleagridis TaxID=135588 RepID=UPI00355972FB|nr:DNA replication licensing factor Mcm2 [Histomonas meleagridis]KAH0805555.1 DNA replication licensing factor Mcm2 [Histomonas meleagridis]